MAMKLNKVLFNGLSCLMLVVSTNAWAIDTKAKNMMNSDIVIYNVREKYWRNYER